MGDVRPVDPVMTNLSIGFKNEAYYWDKLAPVVPVSEKSGTYFIWDKDYWLRKVAGSERAPSAPYTRVDKGVEYWLLMNVLSAVMKSLFTILFVRLLRLLKL